MLFSTTTWVPLIITLRNVATDFDFALTEELSLSS